MQVKVRLFALLKDRAGGGEVALELPDHATVADALVAISKLLPSLSPHLSSAATAVNREYVKTDQLLTPNDELALIPPVSGGGA